MALRRNNQANEAVSKFKLLSAYGGPGSIVHTQYGSIIISCIEEWGFLKRVVEIHKAAVNNPNFENETARQKHIKYTCGLSENGSIGISNDNRLLRSLRDKNGLKGLTNLQYLSLIPDIELDDNFNTIKNTATQFAIPSTFMPKVFADDQNKYKSYQEWFASWITRGKDAEEFFPPKSVYYKNLKQDNIVLICEHGHISDFPWSKFLRWRKDHPAGILNKEAVDLFSSQNCCGTDTNPTAEIRITSSTSNASGFDSKWLKCDNCKRSVSLKGLFNVKIKCPGHKPWEVQTGKTTGHYGDNKIRVAQTKREDCNIKEKINGKQSDKPLKVALTTGNNLYYSRIHSSIYMPDELFESNLRFEIDKLEIELSEAFNNKEYGLLEGINIKIKELKSQLSEEPQEEETSNSEKEVLFRYQEYKALKEKEEKHINIDEQHLKVKDVTDNLIKSKSYFSRVLRIDNMKVTSAQLDFSRVIPADPDAENLISKNIFREKKEEIIVYPVVENYGEGIFFAFNHDKIAEFVNNPMNLNLVHELQSKLKNLENGANKFNKTVIKYGNAMNWQLYLVHTFAHLIMRELEFRCGYPTASLSERIYVSNEDNHKMYGCMIYTTEGAEGSMGGLIAQTRKKNLNHLIENALNRATICNSDPLCYESEGQGLFDLNFASCFSCSLVSETSCEHRNLYLDRKIVVDSNGGFFKNLINN